jgi:hypothetical protein
LDVNNRINPIFIPILKVFANYSVSLPILAVTLLYDQWSSRLYEGPYRCCSGKIP